MNRIKISALEASSVNLRTMEAFASQVSRLPGVTAEMIKAAQDSYAHAAGVSLYILRSADEAALFTVGSPLVKSDGKWNQEADLNALLPTAAEPAKK